jgi:trigger factor
VEYPQEAPPDLAGQSVAYEIDVHEVKRKVLPDLDDEFAKDLGDFADLAALRARLREDLERDKRRDAERQIRNAIMDKVLLENPIVLPEVLVDDELRHRLEQVVRRMYLQGIDPEHAQVDWVKLRDSQVDPARKSVHARLMLDAVAAAEGLAVTPAEVDERIRLEARHLGEPPDKLRKQLAKGTGLQAMKSQLLREKTLDLLVAVANIPNEE